jgi:hypothetical protein
LNALAAVFTDSRADEWILDKYAGAEQPPGYSVRDRIFIEDDKGVKPLSPVIPNLIGDP